MNYQTWLDEFSKGKQHVASLPQSASHFAHSVERYIEGSNTVWEIAQTYTGRFVVRSGQLAEDGITVAWGEWQTKHDVRLPKK